ncbi:MAG: Imm70 family immunity protein [Puniceicoccales bacterium]
MGLYLCIFDEHEEEIEGVEVGQYADFGHFRDCVTSLLEEGSVGSRFPNLLLHSDSDGIWTPQESYELSLELDEIIRSFKNFPAIDFASDWQKQIASMHGHIPKSAYESFIDVDGELLLDRLKELVTISVKRSLPILFQ